jgi:hypothetical protein
MPALGGDGDFACTRCGNETNRDYRAEYAVVSLPAPATALAARRARLRAAFDRFAYVL